MGSKLVRRTPSEFDTDVDLKPREKASLVATCRTETSRDVRVPWRERPGPAVSLPPRDTAGPVHQNLLNHTNLQINATRNLIETIMDRLITQKCYLTVIRIR